MGKTAVWGDAPCGDCEPADTCDVCGGAAGPENGLGGRVTVTGRHGRSRLVRAAQFAAAGIPCSGAGVSGLAFAGRGWRAGSFADIAAWRARRIE